ncbi:MAG TPA: ACP S-malonyltransferase [Gaiellaceae bacterium]
MSTDAGEGRTGKVAFCFPGQGAIEAGMGREIAEAVPEAMAVYERGSESCGLDLRALCFSSPVEDLVDTAVQQPALLATSLGILAAIEALGFKPDFVVGHSVGEFAALSAGKALAAADAIALVRERGLAMAETAKEHPGAMAAILGLEDEVVEELCREIHCVWPANYNCPGQVVISGQTDAVEECCEEAQREGARRTVKLPISGAFHSPLVARAAERFRPVVERVRFSELQVAFMSTVTAQLENRQKLTELLVDQLTAPVRWTQATRGLIADGVRTFVEIGPGNVLSGLVKRIDRSVETISVNSLATLKKVEEVLSVA